jgi:hypothetical protein
MANDTKMNTEVTMECKLDKNTFTEVKIQVEVYWVLTLCSVIGYECFGRNCYLHLQDEVTQKSSIRKEYVWESKITKLGYKFQSTLV